MKKIKITFRKKELEVILEESKNQKPVMRKPLSFLKKMLLLMIFNFKNWWFNSSW